MLPPIQLATPNISATNTELAGVRPKGYVAGAAVFARVAERARARRADEESKALKQKALNCMEINQPFDLALQSWINPMQAPVPVERPEGYVPGGAVRARVGERERVRKEKIARLEWYREQGRAKRKFWIFHKPYPTAPAPSPGLEARRKLAERDEDIARRARVAHLENLRYGGKGSGRKGAMFVKRAQ
ncbi:hypothetical protein B0H15DRAFT_942274 [Mycena belliarum]|uniref:Uncharacterized protein n=1 Tax=Mycena belliarum TaxID=1033014 RepID=A0AAD6UQH6_9AGAR|nr:hypothetical protein B0H15DRAFT_942274 [Mycena belliae]